MHLSVLQQPIAKARHRYYIRGKSIVNFDPQEKEKHATQVLIRNQMNGLKMPSDTALIMSLTTYVDIPKSWSNKKKKSMEGQPCISRPDMDNYLKFYCDVLNEIAYDDDKQITKIIAEKVYSSNPRVEITLEPIGSGMINEHAVTVRGQITPEQLTYLVKKANKLGLHNRQILRVFSEEDDEGKHIYFEAEGLKNGADRSLDGGE